MRGLKWAVAVLAMGAWAWASPISVGQFSMEYPSAETVGYYGFTVANLTGNSTSGACTAGYPVCQQLAFLNPTLTVNYGYGQLVDNGSGVGVQVGPLASQGTYTVTAADPNAFDPSYNGCGVYGVDATCAGLTDTANAFQLPLPVTDGNGNNLIILQAVFTATSAPTVTGQGTLSGPYTATLLPPSDCAGPCNFLDPGLYDGDPNTGYWEYYDATVDITTDQPTPPSEVPEPATWWLMGSAMAGLGMWWRKRAVA